jgi:2-hydroxy-3-oxopropionate reductase
MTALPAREGNSAGSSGSATMTIAFVGLGIMGSPMASRLLGAGYSVVGFNRTPQKMEQFVRAGGHVAKSIGEAAAGADVAITMLPDSPDVERVVLAEDGLLADLRPGSLLIDMSTIRPDTARRLADEGRALDIAVLDAPVSGGQQGATEGTLSIMVGGDADAFERARNLFSSLGTTVVHVGPSGAGQIVKAANQMIVAGTIELVAEAMIFLGAWHVDREAALQVLAGGLAGSKVLDRKAEAMLRRRFEPGFRIDLHHKDLGIALSAAREAGVILPVGAVVAQLMGAARAQGMGELDHAALLVTLENLSRLPRDGEARDSPPTG